MMTSALTNLLLLFLALGLGIAVFVMGILLFLSYLGGWGALARDYASAPETNKGTLLEEKHQFQARVGLISFGGLVTAYSFERGIELKAVFPFSPPLFFPWEEISEYKLVNVFPFPQAQQFTVGGRNIRLSNSLTELARRKAQG